MRLFNTIATSSQRIAVSVLVLLLLSACGVGRSSEDTDALMSGDAATFGAAVQRHLAATAQPVQAVEVFYDQLWAGTFRQRIVFYTFSQPVGEHTQPGFGYAVVAHQGQGRWDVTHNRSVVLNDPPTLVAYDSEQYDDVLIVYGRVFNPSVTQAQLQFDTTKRARAVRPPPTGIAAIEPYANALTEITVGDENMTIKPRTYAKPRLLTRGEE